jgi:hypothetical protein
LFSGFNVFTSKVGTVVHDSKGCAVPQIVSQSLVSHCGGTRLASCVVFVMDKEALGTSLALEYLGYNVYQFFTVTNVIQCACGAFKIYPMCYGYLGIGVLPSN